MEEDEINKRIETELSKQRYNNILFFGIIIMILSIMILNSTSFEGITGSITEQHIIGSLIGFAGIYFTGYSMYKLYTYKENPY